MVSFESESPLNPNVVHAERIAAFRRAEADAAKAAKRRDSFAKKLKALGVDQ
jgi:hypothetical protein